MTKIDEILQEMETLVETNQSVHATVWINYANKLNILKGNLDDELAEKRFEIAKMKDTWMLDPKMTSTKAQVKIEATKEYLEMEKLAGKEKRIVSQIQIAKKLADVTDKTYTHSGDY